MTPERLLTALDRYMIQPQSRDVEPRTDDTWAVIDTKTADPETNWPGELVSEHPTHTEARTGLMKAILAEFAASQRLTIAGLQAAHVARQAEWCPDQLPDLSFRGNELAGEAGETSEALILHAAEISKLAGRASNIVKKLERERHGWRGSRATKADLAAELADVIHCAVLCAITADIDLDPAVTEKFNATSEKQGLSVFLPQAGSVLTGDALDAARFQALMRCGRIKMQGSAGLEPDTGALKYPDRPGSVHFGAELWPQGQGEPDLSTIWGRNAIRALADDILALEAAALPSTTEADLVPQLRAGCRSAITPCEQQRNNPDSVCATCRQDRGPNNPRPEHEQREG